MTAERTSPRFDEGEEADENQNGDESTDMEISS